MRKATFCAAIMIATLGMAAHPGDASAQRRINCASQVGRRAVCEADTRGGVFLRQQRSTAPCTFGQTWGFTSRAVWVSNGCRGQFVVDIPPAGSGGGAISVSDALRICRNTVAARLAMTNPDVVRVDIHPVDNQAGRSIGWSTSDGRAGSCRVSATGEVTGWTIRKSR